MTKKINQFSSAEETNKNLTNTENQEVDLSKVNTLTQRYKSGEQGLSDTLNDNLQGGSKIEEKEVTLEQAKQEILSFLNDIYGKNMYLKDINMIGENTFEGEFIFNGNENLTFELGHVSESQMAIARFQIYFAGITMALQQETLGVNLSYNFFIKEKFNILQRKMYIVNHIPIKIGDPAMISIKFELIKSKGNFYVCDATFPKDVKNYFLSGGGSCVIIKNK